MKESKEQFNMKFIKLSSSVALSIHPEYNPPEVWLEVYKPRLNTWEPIKRFSNISKLVKGLEEVIKVLKSAESD